MSRKSEIRRTLMLSTAHLSKSTRCWLGRTLEERDGSGNDETHRWIDCGAHDVLAYPHEFGWFVHIPDLITLQRASSALGDLMACFAWGHRQDCDWVIFDRDVPHQDGLPTYDGVA